MKPTCALYLVIENYLGNFSYAAQRHIMYQVCQKNVLTKEHFLHTLYKRAREQISIEEMLMLTHEPNENYKRVLRF